jgi:hypothetical protein
VPEEVDRTVKKSKSLDGSSLYPSPPHPFDQSVDLVVIPFADQRYEQHVIFQMVDDPVFACLGAA